MIGPAYRSSRAALRRRPRYSTTARSLAVFFTLVGLISTWFVRLMNARFDALGATIDARLETVDVRLTHLDLHVQALTEHVSRERE